MKKTVLLMTGAAIMATSFSVSAEAGPFDQIKKKVERVKKKAKDVETVVETADRANRTNGRSLLGDVLGGLTGGGGTGCGTTAGSSYPCTAPAPGHVGRAAPIPAKFINQTQCANLNVGNAFIGRGGKYTFSQGISTQERSGIVDRAPVQATNGCVFPTMGVGDILYVEVDRAKYKKHSYAIQCVSYDGSEQLSNVNGPSVGNYKGKDVMLHTGHSLGYEPTATGSNSSRSGAYDKVLKSRGREMITFNFGGLHTDKSGTDFFCQWYDKDQGKSAVAFAYRRGPTG